MSHDETRILDIVLILAILVGGVLAWRTGREQGASGPPPNVSRVRPET